MNHAHKLNMDVRSKHSSYFLLSNLLWKCISCPKSLRTVPTNYGNYYFHNT